MLINCRLLLPLWFNIKRPYIVKSTPSKAPRSITLRFLLCWRYKLLLLLSEILELLSFLISELINRHQFHRRCFWSQLTMNLAQMIKLLRSHFIYSLIQLLGQVWRSINCRRQPASLIQHLIIIHKIKSTRAIITDWLPIPQSDSIAKIVNSNILVNYRIIFVILRAFMA